MIISSILLILFILFILITLTSSESDPYTYLVKLDYYDTENTKYATDDGWSQVTKVTICEDSPNFVASNCVSGINEYQCTGNQMIKLFSKDWDDWYLEQQGKYHFCGTCSELVYTYKGYGCKDFWVFAGCFGDEKCSGQLTLEGTIHPTSQPTRQPSRQPTSQPSRQPTSQPSRQPSRQPTSKPSSQPISSPTGQPSGNPTQSPTTPTGQPTGLPTAQPNVMPSSKPTGLPSLQPSMQPSRQPSVQPTVQPSGQPSITPSSSPTSSPTAYLQFVDYSEYVEKSFTLCAALDNIELSKAGRDYYCNLYSSNKCTESDIKSYSCIPTCLKSAPAAFCHYFPILSELCGQTLPPFTQNITNQNIIENKCTEAFLQNADSADLTPVVIEVQLTFPGISAASINADPNTLTAIELALKSTVPGVTEVEIEVTDASRRRNLDNSSNRRKLSLSSLITAKLKSVTSLLGYSSSNAGAAGSASASVLSKSISNGKFSSNLAAAAVASGSSMTSQLVTSSKSVTMTTSILTTSEPSASPTLIPEVIPGLTQPELIAAVVMAIIGSCCFVGFIIVALGRHQDRKYKLQLEKATMKVSYYEKPSHQDYSSILGGIQLNSVDVHNGMNRSAVSVNHLHNPWFEEVKDDKMIQAKTWDNSNWT